MQCSHSSLSVFSVTSNSFIEFVIRGVDGVHKKKVWAIKASYLSRLRPLNSTNEFPHLQGFLKT